MLKTIRLPTFKVRKFRRRGRRLLARTWLSRGATWNGLCWPGNSLPFSCSLEKSDASLTVLRTSKPVTALNYQLLILCRVLMPRCKCQVSCLFLQGCTLLLLVLFVYDVFFVFITPFLTKVSQGLLWGVLLREQSVSASVSS